MVRKVFIFVGVLSIAMLALPAIALAAEEKTILHLVYERSFGPVGAVAGIIAMVVFWQLSQKVERDFGFALKLLVLILLFINIESITFGVHGAGLLGAELSRYIERTLRLLSLLTADIAALLMYWRLNKKS